MANVTASVLPEVEETTEIMTSGLTPMAKAFIITGGMCALSIIVGWLHIKRYIQLWQC